MDYEGVGAGESTGHTGHATTTTAATPMVNAEFATVVNHITTLQAKVNAVRSIAQINPAN
jgi:hypothetical protein